MKKINVAHIITKLELGGAQQNTLYTLAHLDKQRFSAFLIAGPGGMLNGEARTLCNSAFFEVPQLRRAVSPHRDVVALSSLRSILTRLPRPLIVHTHSSKAGVLGRLAARSVRAEGVVHSVHGFAFHSQQAPAKRWIFERIEHTLGPFADAYICVSRADKQSGMRLGLFDNADVELIRSGIVVADFAFSKTARQVLRRQLGIAQDALVVGTVANFKPQKAPLDFVRIAAVVLRQHPHCQFIYVGDGEQRAQVEAHSAALGLGRQLHLVGWQQDVAAYLSTFDVFLLCSHHEGLPRAVLQALANACPVVATRTGGTDEVLETEQLAEPGEIEALSRLVLQGLAKASIVDRAVPAVDLTAFDADLMVRRQERLYVELLNR